MRTKKTSAQPAKTKKRRSAPVPTVATPEPSPPSLPKGKLSALSAAARVLAETGQAMNCRQLIDAMSAQGYWTSPDGRTPEATLATAVTMLPKVA